MQGVGKLKEAGTKAWGRPFWIMLQGLSLTLPLGGCLLTGDKPEPALNIPWFYDYGPRKPIAAEAAVPPLDWWRSFRSRELTEVIEAASTKPFGFMPFFPGPGAGGHCIPLDPLYLAWKAKQQGFVSRFIDLADQINTEMPAHVVDLVVDGPEGARDLLEQL